MKKVFEQEFENPVWKIIPNQTQTSVLVELRSETSLELNLQIVDLDNLDVSQLDLVEQLDWWSVIDSFDEDTIYFNHLKDENDPSQMEYYKWDTGTGQIEALSSPKSITTTSSVQIPFFYEMESEGFSTFQEFLQAYRKKPVKGVEYLENDNYIFFSYYELHVRDLSRYIMILDREGNILVDEQLDQEMNGIVFESFFTFHSMVIFVVNKKKLVVYRY